MSSYGSEIRSRTSKPDITEEGRIEAVNEIELNRGMFGLIRKFKHRRYIMFTNGYEESDKKPYFLIFLILLLNRLIKGLLFIGLLSKQDIQNATVDITHDDSKYETKLKIIYYRCMTIKNIVVCFTTLCITYVIYCKMTFVFYYTLNTYHDNVRNVNIENVIGIKDVGKFELLQTDNYIFNNWLRTQEEKRVLLDANLMERQYTQGYFESKTYYDLYCNVSVMSLFETFQSFSSQSGSNINCLCAHHLGIARNIAYIRDNQEDDIKFIWDPIILNDLSLESKITITKRIPGVFKDSLLDIDVPEVIRTESRNLNGKKERFRLYGSDSACLLNCMNKL